MYVCVIPELGCTDWQTDFQKVETKVAWAGSLDYEDRNPLAVQVTKWSKFRVPAVAASQKSLRCNISNRMGAVCVQTISNLLTLKQVTDMDGCGGLDIWTGCATTTSRYLC